MFHVKHRRVPGLAQTSTPSSTRTDRDTTLNLQRLRLRRYGTVRPDRTTTTRRRRRTDSVAAAHDDSSTTPPPRGSPRRPRDLVLGALALQRQQPPATLPSSGRHHAASRPAGRPLAPSPTRCADRRDHIAATRPDPGPPEPDRRAQVRRRTSSGTPPAAASTRPDRPVGRLAGPPAPDRATRPRNRHRRPAPTPATARDTSALLTSAAPTAGRARRTEQPVGDTVAGQQSAYRRASRPTRRTRLGRLAAISGRRARPDHRVTAAVTH